ncbi:MAG: multicopper oxidase family protein [Acidimicrobiales bacterium]
MSRREFLVFSGAATAALSACAKSPAAIKAGDAAVAAAERRRRNPQAPVREVSLTAGTVSLDTGRGSVTTWGYNGTVPGPEIRLTKGDVLRAWLTNQLPEPTSIHWHGLAIRNDMDGVPGTTQKDIAPGATFTYEFTVPESGTFWFHPHSGTQLDRGLYAPFIIDDPSDTERYDGEWVVMLDDWTDGVGEAPDAILKRLSSSPGMASMAGMDMAGMQMGKSSPLLGGDSGDVIYPLYFLNGRPPANPAVFDAKAGQRLRIRLINAGAETAFRVALGGHRLTVTHTDGFPVEPVTGDAVLVGMAERYDVSVTVAGDGVFPLVAMAEGKGAQALGLVRSGPGQPPPPDVHPAELDGKVLAVGDLMATAAVTLPSKAPDRVHQVTLTTDMDRFRWRINGRTFDKRVPLDVRQGQRVRLVFENRTPMFHPMHLHGHTFQVAGPNGAIGPRKDTVIVRPMEQVTVDFIGDNPGQWLLHCHNLYHQETGMMTIVSYVT